jgi:uncharacterized membrane protein
MHLIPQSWSHWHILISVFPTVGFLFVLGVYISGLRSRSDFVRRACLTMFALLGLLSIPIYVSGARSLAALSENPRFPKDAIATHYVWGVAALAVLVISGVLAGMELWRSWRAHRETADPFHLVLTLGIITLGLTGNAGEFGLRINHRELQLTATIQDISTPQAWSHAHIILNHIPTAGIVFAIAFFAVALVANNDLLKRASLALFVICAIFGVPTYVAGTAAMWALTQPAIPDMPISKAVINAHRDMALWTLFGLALTGGIAWIELWRSRYRGNFSRLSLGLVLLFAFVTLAVMTETGHRGGLINHPEIVLATDNLPTDVNTGISDTLEALMKDMFWFSLWQTVHFFGYSLIFGSAFAVALRVLGFWKSASFAAMHQLLVLGFAGVLLNVVSGMLMMLSDSYRYVVGDIGFAPKIVFISIGATAVLYFSLSKPLFHVKAGENAPAAAKWVAAAVLLSWVGVIAFGRMLPFL